VIARAERRPRRGGFTMVEAIATIVVLAVLGSVTSGIILQAVDGYTEASTQAQLHAEMSIALDRAVRELRKIPLDSGAGGIAPDVDDLSPTSVDWEGDYHLGLTGGDLLMTINGGAQRVLMSDVSAFGVSAFDESNAALGATLSGAACDPIRRLELTLTASRHGVTATVRTRVYLRSTMEGAA